MHLTSLLLPNQWKISHCTADKGGCLFRMLPKQKQLAHLLFAVLATFPRASLSHSSYNSQEGARDTCDY